jgi:hypothetical protein
MFGIEKAEKNVVLCQWRHVHDGEWQNGDRHGQGVYTWANGDTYDGEWQNGDRHGQGVCIYADGRKYDGEWKNGDRHGQGVCIYADDRKYDGEWQYGQRHGEGVLTYPNGSKYDGSWQHDKEYGCLGLGLGLDKWFNQLSDFLNKSSIVTYSSGATMLADTPNSEFVELFNGS